MSRYVYVIGIKDGPHKIGVATDLRSRFSSIQTSSPVPLILHKSWEHDDPFAVEQRAHAILRFFRLKGEWFRVTTKLACQAVKQAIADIAAGKGADVVREIIETAPLPFPWLPHDLASDMMPQDDDAPPPVEDDPEPEPEIVYPDPVVGHIGFGFEDDLTPAVIHTLRMEGVSGGNVYTLRGTKADRDVAYQAMRMDLRDGDTLFVFSGSGLPNSIPNVVKKANATLRIIT